MKNNNKLIETLDQIETSIVNLSNLVNVSLSNGPKYELVNEDSIKHNGKKLYRIRALMAFGDVKAGEEGGYVQSEKNLSQEGLCWLGGDSKAYENAVVSGGAYMNHKSEAFGKALIQSKEEEGVYIGDNAMISGNAKVYHAVIKGDVQITGGTIGTLNAAGHISPRINDQVIVSGGTISGLVVIDDECKISGNVSIEGKKIKSVTGMYENEAIHISGNVRVLDNSKISGEKLKILNGVFIDGDCSITGVSLRIENKVQIGGSAVVNLRESRLSGNLQVYDNAKLSGSNWSTNYSPKVYNNALLSGDNIYLGDQVQIYGDANITLKKSSKLTDRLFIGNAQIYGESRLDGFGRLTVGDKAKIYGNFYGEGNIDVPSLFVGKCELFGDARISIIKNKNSMSKLIIDDNAQISGNARITVPSLECYSNVKILGKAEITVKDGSHTLIVDQTIENKYTPPPLTKTNLSRVPQCMADIVFKSRN